MHRSLIIAIALLLPSLASAAEARVSIPRAMWMRLLDLPEDEEEIAPLPSVRKRSVRLIPEEQSVVVEASWVVDTVKPGWMQATLVNRPVELLSATFDGRPAAVSGGNTLHWVGRVERRSVLTIRVRVDGDARQGIQLGLLPAPVGTLDVAPVTGLEPRLVVDQIPVVSTRGGRFGGGASLQFSLAPPEPEAKAQTVVLASVGLGVTVGEASTAFQARVQWRVATGSVDQVSFRLPAAAADLVVTGGNIAEWRRQGQQVVVKLRTPSRDRVDVLAQWSEVTPEGDTGSVPLPTISVDGAFRTEHALQVARDDTIEVIPEVRGVQGVASQELPVWGRGLITGTPTSAYAGERPTQGALSLLRFTPLSGPPTLVDVASFEASLTDEGRMLLRAHYTVRNERGAFLRVTPPKGSTILSARVANETAVIVEDGDDWLLPLSKSVETVEGLLSFPVEVVMLSSDLAWDRKEERTLELPRVDAEVAVSRVTLHLPEGYEATDEIDEGRRVADFSEGSGITYGFGVGDVRAAEADALFQEAVNAWMANDFTDVQDKLDDLKDMGASNENVARLQSNLDLLESGGEENNAIERRVKEQAKARSYKQQAEQEKVLEEAEQAYLAGDYDKAEAQYQQALDLGNDLAKLEQKESLDVSASNSAVAGKLSKAKEKKKSKGEVVSVTESITISLGGAAAPEPDILFGDDGEGEIVGYGALGATGAGLGGGGTAEGLGGLGTKGVGSGSSGYGRGGGAFGARGEAVADSDDDWGDGYLGEGVVGGVEGGVVGGVLGGVLGGAVADNDSDGVLDNQRFEAERRAAEADARQKAEEASAQRVLSTEEAQRAEVLEKEFLTRVPTGRSYQQSISTVAGVSGKAKKGPRKADKDTTSMDQPDEVYVLDGANVAGPTTGLDANRAAPTSPAAQAEAGEGRYRERTEIDFEDVEITGELVKPQGELLLDRKRANFEPLDVVDLEEAIEEEEEDWDEAPMLADEVTRRSGRGAKSAPTPAPARDAKPAASPAPPPPPPPAERSTRTDRVQSVSKMSEVVVVERAKPRFKLPSVSMKKMAEAPPMVEEEAVTIEIGGSFDAPLEVKATTVSVVLPARGQTTRYQQLLLPAGEAPEVVIRAKKSKRRGT